MTWPSYPHEAKVHVLREDVDSRTVCGKRAPGWGKITMKPATCRRCLLTPVKLDESKDH